MCRSMTLCFFTLFFLLGTVSYGSLANVQANPVTGDTQTGEHVFHLQYKEGDLVALTMRLDLHGREVTFKKEPDFQGRNVLRSALSIGGEKPFLIPFVWDPARRTLYVDLNRNLDLTDDPGGIFTSESRGAYQIFRSVHLETQQGPAQLRYLIDLYLMRYRSATNGTLIVHSGWQGQVELQGEKWYVAVIDNLDGIIESSAGRESDRFVIRPWKPREEPFSKSEDSSGHFDALPPVSSLFLNDHAYKLAYSFEPKEGCADLKVVFSETEAKLGELKLSGTSIRRLLLEGDTNVILYSPKAVVRIPVGNYTTRAIVLQAGDSPLSASQDSSERITITETAPAVLDVGGPLQNAVTVSRNDDILLLSYQLVGRGGKSYSLVNQDSENPPQFAVYRNEKKIFSGAFQYG